MAAAYVGERFTGHTSGSAVGSQTCAWSGATIGNLLVAQFSLGNNILTRSIGTCAESDGGSVGTAWDVIACDTSTTTGFGLAYTRALATSGSVVLNMSSGTAVFMTRISEFSGIDFGELAISGTGTASAWFSSQNWNFQKTATSGVTAPSGPSVTELGDRQALGIGCWIVQTAQASYTAGSGWTQLGSILSWSGTNPGAHVGQYRTDCADGSSYTNTGTLATATDSRGYTGFVAFFPAAKAPPVEERRRRRRRIVYR